jgi:hypothetical protein
MGDSREQHEAGDPLRVCTRKGGGDRAAERMSDQHEPVEADTVERLRDERRLPCRRSIRLAARPVAPAVAGTVDQHHPARLREAVTKCQPEVAQIAAGAMDQHHRPERVRLRGAWRVGGLIEIEHMKLAAVDFDKPAGRGMRSLDAAGRDGGDQETRADDGGQCEEGDTGHVFHCCTDARVLGAGSPLPRRRSTGMMPMPRRQCSQL